LVHYNDGVLMEIRKARHGDIKDIIAMGIEFINTGWKHTIEPSSESLLIWLHDFLNHPGAVVWLAIEDGEAVGMIGGMVYPMYFNQNHLHAQEFFWWVKPERRNSRAGLRLIDAFEQWAIKQGAATIQMGTVDKASPKSLVRLYEKRGYIPAENSFIRKV